MMESSYLLSLSVHITFSETKQDPVVYRARTLSTRILLQAKQGVLLP